MEVVIIDCTKIIQNGDTCSAECDYPFCVAKEVSR